MEIPLETILEKLPVLATRGNLKKVCSRIVSATSAELSDADLTWVSDKNQSLLSALRRGTVICSAKADQSSFNQTCTYLIVDNPRQYFLKVIKNYFVDDEPPSISQHAVIHPSVQLGKNVTVKAGVIIEENCRVGDHSRIDSNTVIKKATLIGARVIIGANNTIGGVGFGYEKDENNNYELLPHIGNVVIEDHVEIGNNTCIDRAVVGSTILRRNCKIDNLVHIAHGVEIGENSLVIANAMVAGSAIIGKNVWVAPSASVLNKAKIEDGAVVGMGAVVLKDVAAGQTVVGNPAKDIKTLRKNSP
jgi:UDP-3-O-[3-hydroxymyristoyl] glucosamine N-acyltransferase